MKRQVPVEVLVLGPVEARVDGAKIRLSGVKQRAVLARLLLQRGRALRPAQLCEELWGSDPPRDPLHALQAHVSRLRAVLPVRIELVNGGYRLEPTGIISDVERFERLRGRAAVQLAAGDLAQSVESLGAALSTWRGPAFSDVVDVPALKAEAARLEADRTATLADRIDLDLALGRSAVLVPELSSLVAEHPSYERFWGQLMLALYATGRVQDALEVFDRARTAFVDASGTEPNAHLRHLHVEILRERPVQSLLRVPGSAGTRIRSDGVGGGRPEPAGAGLSSNRHVELLARLTDGRALLLTGAAGIGKTHLLHAVRERLGGHGRSVVLLRANGLGRDVPLGAFAGIDVGLEAGATSIPAVVDHFSRRRSEETLLVDDVHLLDVPSLYVITQLVRAGRTPMVLTARDLPTAPAEVRDLYDSGELTEVPVRVLSEAEAHDLASHLLDGPMTPAARTRILTTAAGNPMLLREIIAGSMAAGRLVATSHGWDLRGEPAPTTRLAQLVAERFSGLDDAAVEVAMRVAIAGELPAKALDPAGLAALARTDLIAVAANGWLRLAHPMDGEVLRRRSTDLAWRELTRDVVRLLRSDLVAAHPQVRHRADLLALDLDDPVDVPATLLLAERALAAFDEELALRAAQAIIEREPTHTDGHRVLALAASALGRAEQAEEHFGVARDHATSDGERAAIARAHAQHRGLRLQDAVGALRIVEQAREHVGDPAERAHLERARMRWGAVAGMGPPPVAGPALTGDTADALSLVTVGMSAVITGPLSEADRVLAQLHRIPPEIIERVPGAAALIALTEIMALSYSGDIAATHRRLHRQIAHATTHAPETLGMWEYALGFSELLSGDAERALVMAQAATAHLRWRDSTGLIPAAHALAGAAASVTGRYEESDAELAAVPESAATDPKVVMLRAWAEAWRANVAGRQADAARVLVDASAWLMAAQHTFFAGMLAHAAMRTGHLGAEARRLLDEAALIAGGGLIDFFVRHAEAQQKADPFGLDVVAREARDLGMFPSAVDTWATLLALTDDDVLAAARRESVADLRRQHPSMAVWSGSVVTAGGS